MREVKASVMTEPRKIETRSYPYPSVKDDSLLMKIAMCGVCGTDVHLFKGHRLPAGNVPFPFIPGHEVVGTVEKIGSRANETMKISGGPLKEGDRVLLLGARMCDTCWGCRHFGGSTLNCSNIFGYGFVECNEPPYLFGGYGEYMYVISNSWIWKIPEEMPWEVVVLADPLSIGVRAIDRALSVGSLGNNVLLPFQGNVVVQGSGAIGTLAAAAAKVAGAKQIIMTGAPESRLRLAREMGAVDHTIDVLETQAKERAERVHELTDGNGADVVLECAGVPEALSEGLTMVRKSGTLVELGNFLDVGRNIELNVCRDICSKDLVLHSVYGPSPHSFEKAFYMLQAANKRFSFSRLVTHRFPIDEAANALMTAESEKCMKAVIEGS